MSSHPITINHACSLGRLCYSSQFCKDALIKRESYPFDWIFSTPRLIIDVLKDDFSKFLDKRYFISRRSDRCGHSFYNSMMPVDMFFHHNPLTNEEHYNYFTRCVSRFRKLASLNSAKLFIITCPDQTDETIEASKQHVIELNTYLKTYTTNYYIAVIIHISSCTKTDFSITNEDNINWIIARTQCKLNGVRLVDNQENAMVHAIIKSQYNFDIRPL